MLAIRTYTVKASNFGPHANFVELFFFRRDSYHQNASYRKMKRINVAETLFTFKLCSVHFLYKIHPKMIRILQEYVHRYQ